MNAPAPKRAMYFRGTDGGTLCANEAMVIDQANNGYKETNSQKNLRETHCMDKIIKGFQWACQCG